MSLHHINAKDVFKEKNEAHYRFHEHIDPDQSMIFMSWCLSCQGDWNCW